VEPHRSTQVMHRLGQADLRTTARYVHVLDETGSQPLTELRHWPGSTSCAYSGWWEV
jgi:hypothetical protein